jgi:glycerol-3-phosphate dehydrogenase
MGLSRPDLIKRVKDREGDWDLIIVGGGATGLGVGVDAASRGYQTLLLEQHDFSKGTSSRSTKLIHGGVRYLRQGNIALVIEALHERGILIRSAPHLVTHQAFIVPTYEWWDGPFYGAGLKVYDMLAGKLGLGPSKRLSVEQTLEKIPTLEPKGLRGGVVYYDGQFDDSRLAVNLAQTMAAHGATPLNYFKVTGFIKTGGMIHGVVAQDLENGNIYEIHGRVVVNATGVFSDQVRKLDNPHAGRMIHASQGVHLVLGKEFLPGRSAIMVPQTSDGRVLFAVPWHDRVIVGTTDTPVAQISLEPRAFDHEIDFILEHAAAYMRKDPTRKDVKSVFAGLRPLVQTGKTQNTAHISREHHLLVSESGLVTITGGKWTTYRKMAAETVHQALSLAGLPERECVTKDLRIHGWMDPVDPDDPLACYGSDGARIRELMRLRPELAVKLHPGLPYLKAEVVWSVRSEMARTVEDFLARRSRALLLDARASIEMAPGAARLMAAELGFDRSWQAAQVQAFEQLAKGYMC